MSRKILIVGNNSNGMYLFRGMLISELVRRGNEVVVLIPFDLNVDDLRALGARVVETPIDRRGMNPLKDFSLIRLYNRLLNAEKPDVVMTFTIKPNVYCGYLCGKKHIRQLANITGLGTSIQNKGFIKNFILFLYRKGLKKSETIFFQNQKNLDVMRGYGVVNNNTVLLPGSGVDLSKHPFETYPMDDDKLIFLIIGRIMKDKGTDEILEAASIIKKQYPNVVFRFIGEYDGDYQERIDAAVRKGYVEYLDNQDDIHPFIKNSHATIHASYHEGMSNVLQETAAAGRPVIASNIPGCKETYEPYVSGIPFEPKNSDDLVRAIREFIALPYSEKVKMGIAGRKRMEAKFDRKIVVNQYIEKIEKED